MKWDCLYLILIVRNLIPYYVVSIKNLVNFDGVTVLNTGFSFYRSHFNQFYDDKTACKLSVHDVWIYLNTTAVSLWECLLFKSTVRFQIHTNVVYI